LVFDLDCAQLGKRFLASRFEFVLFPFADRAACQRKLEEHLPAGLQVR
jgi:hypothetical protein